MDKIGQHHPLIVALTHHLPPTGGTWTEDKQRRWMAALEATVRLIYDVIPSTPKPRPKHRVQHIDPPY